MDLYNCETEDELKLKEIEVETLTIAELEELAETIYTDFRDGTYEDENITVTAIHQINIELLKRLGRIKDESAKRVYRFN